MGSIGRPCASARNKEHAVPTSPSSRSILSLSLYNIFTSVSLVTTYIVSSLGTEATVMATEP